MLALKPSANDDGHARCANILYIKYTRIKKPNDDEKILKLHTAYLKRRGVRAKLNIAVITAIIIIIINITVVVVIPIVRLVIRDAEDPQKSSTRMFVLSLYADRKSLTLGTWTSPNAKPHIFRSSTFLYK